MLVSPDASHVPMSYKLICKVNQVEYEACIAKMETALELGVKRLEVIGDSNSVVSQARGEWKVKEEILSLYHSVFFFCVGKSA